jgi:hypothetical protein
VARQSLNHLPASLSLAIMRCAFWSGPALTSTAVLNRAAWQVSIWLSALRQPAHHLAAPNCHTPSPCGWPSCGGQCGVQCRGKPPHNAASRSHGLRPSLPGICNGEL